MSCTNYKEVLFPECPTSARLKAQLVPGNEYAVVVTDKFQKQYRTTVTADEDGDIVLLLNQSPFIPGQFMSFSGTFRIQLFSDEGLVSVEDSYNGYEMWFAETFDGGEPILDQPHVIDITGATGPTEVVHNLGHKPVVQVLDTDGVLISSGFSVTHNSNNSFTYEFDVATSGTILYL